MLSTLVTVTCDGCLLPALPSSTSEGFSVTASGALVFADAPASFTPLTCEVVNVAASSAASLYGSVDCTADDGDCFSGSSTSYFVSTGAGLITSHRSVLCLPTPSI